MITSKNFNTKLTTTDTEFARDYVLPATKPTFHFVSCRTSTNVVTKLGEWAL